MTRKFHTDRYTRCEYWVGPEWHLLKDVIPAKAGISKCLIANDHKSRKQVFDLETWASYNRLG